MKSATYLLLFILFLSTTLSAQQLYMPRDVKKAFNKGTRSPDGRPGPRYWQNKASYNIDITALPPDRTIRGKEEIVYTNSSPDSLRNLVLKLFLNIHKPGAPRTGGASDDYLTSGVHIDGFSING
ncbi:MAG TPA: peptidase, partial [Chitinophagaceae bacterium]|nr:peptidase [Chitinophagaceae bacterium]